jgi:hypothetical protein
VLPVLFNFRQPIETDEFQWHTFVSYFDGVKDILDAQYAAQIYSWQFKVDIGGVFDM